MRRVIIMGAAGRDFHNFNIFFRTNPRFKVVCFTATQIPNITGRRYPTELAGKQYPRGIPIYPENKLTELIHKHHIDVVVFSYSDISHNYVMHKASEVIAASADFWLLGPHTSMLTSRKKIISVCASRTGAGKSQTSRYLCDILKANGIRFSAVRHPMPYGDLRKQIVQKFSTLRDLDKHKCTIEEREEYAPHIRRGNTVFAGVDYGRILRQAEKISDVIVWDGGNNDLPFYKPDLHIVVTDPFRVGDESTYHPGEANVRYADVVMINKVDTAPRKNIAELKKNIKQLNKNAVVIEATSPTSVDDPSLIKNKKVIVVEDGPTVTHGGMSFGAGVVTAKRYRARIIDPRPHVIGSIKKAYVKYPHLDKVVPALGYGAHQIKELEKSLNRAPVDAIVMATPVDLRKFMKLNKPVAQVVYELKEKSGSELEKLIEKFIVQRKRK
ncbi:GTPase [candidate division WOR_3 bacterium SM23_60]|uniref:GTPase n=1 Tax=candidate division WOR_3 bacterium SM23_60 TaxID=1703780 RepID=A0A0S8GKJ7_UNCW3|nr:MAG: GTPase [candidate division WOR_3 bacterium SM23_60]